jgi:hypothetical protein
VHSNTQLLWTAETSAKDGSLNVSEASTSLKTNVKRWKTGMGEGVVFLWRDLVIGKSAVRNITVTEQCPKPDKFSSSPSSAAL